eukprot:COSAG02_NODE_60825_length_270_cov_0.608187_1_plen_33_part_10
MESGAAACTSPGRDFEGRGVRPPVPQQALPHGA